MTVMNRKRDAQPVRLRGAFPAEDIVKREGLHVLVKNGPNSAQWWVIPKPKRKRRNEQRAEKCAEGTVA